MEANAQIILRSSCPSSPRRNRRPSKSLVQPEVEVSGVICGCREVLEVLGGPRQVGRGYVFHESQRRRVDHVLRDGRVGKRQSRRRVEDLNWLAVDQGLRKITVAFQGGRYCRQEVVRRIAICAVVIEKVKRLRAAVIDVRNI